jgi:hypothetical protein
MNRWGPGLLAFTVIGGLDLPVMAQDAEISGVWRAVEGSPSAPGMPGASDVQTLTLTPDGRYRRQIVVEGGNGEQGAGGTFLDTGQFRFTAPSTFAYTRQSYDLCTAITCSAYPAPPPDQGSLTFVVGPSGHARFIGLDWTRGQ